MIATDKNCRNNCIFSVLIYLLGNAELVDSRKVIRIGAYFSLAGAGASTNGVESYDGFRFVIEKLNSVQTIDSRYDLQIVLCDDMWDTVIARNCWKKFAVDDPVDLVVGGHTKFTIDAANYFEGFGLLNLQCCTGPNSVYAAQRKYPENCDSRAGLFHLFLLC
jgi:ABC-type branched-subunit amino acid transport system substrate-binding protein